MVCSVDWLVAAGFVVHALVDYDCDKFGVQNFFE